MPHVVKNHKIATTIGMTRFHRCVKIRFYKKSPFLITPTIILGSWDFQRIATSVDITKFEGYCIFCFLKKRGKFIYSYLYRLFSNLENP